MMRPNKDHRVLAVKEFQEKDYEDVLKRPLFCRRQGHEEKELEYVCKRCETAVCQMCVNLDHGGHTLTLIKEEAEAQKIEMTALIQNQRDFLQEKTNAVTQLDKDYATVLQHGENVIQDVEKIANTLINTIQAKKQNIITAVENEMKKSLESLTTEKNEIQQQINVMETSLENADKLLARSTDAEVIQLRKTLQTIFDGVDQTKPTARDPEGLLPLVFVENQRMLDTVNGQEIGFLGDPRLRTKASESVADGKGLNEGTVGREVQFNLITRNANKRQCYNNDDNVTVEIRDEQGQECVTKVQIDDKKDGVYSISYSPRVQGRCNLSIKVNGEHVQGSPFSVLVKPFHLKPLFSFGKQGSADGMFQNPQGVAVNHRDEIAVTDELNHRVQIFNNNGNFMRSFCRQGSNNGELNGPIGIAFDKDGNIFVVDNGNSRIQRFSGEGRYMSQFGGDEGSLDSQLSNPWGLSLDSNGNIIVADVGNKLIKIFSPDGKFLMKIGGPVHCVQCDEYLIVSDLGDRSIKVFTREGKYKYKFGKQGEGDGEFNYPRFLTVTKTGLLMVCDWGNHRIQVFELNGKFVGKFGTKGNNLGDLNNPFAVAVLSNNQIVVSDFNNYRVQIFE